jgi:hypothetical protein
MQRDGTKINSKLAQIWIFFGCNEEKLFQLWFRPISCPSPFQSRLPKTPGHRHALCGF